MYLLGFSLIDLSLLLARQCQHASCNGNSQLQGCKNFKSFETEETCRVKYIAMYSLWDVLRAMNLNLGHEYQNFVWFRGDQEVSEVNNYCTASFVCDSTA